MILNWIKWLLWNGRKRRDTAAAESLAEELDRFADLMKEVLEITNTRGEITDHNRAAEVKRLCRRNTNRFLTLIESGAYRRLGCDLQQEIDRKLRVVHYAPGSTVQAINLIEAGIDSGSFAVKARNEFATAIDGVRDLAVRLRLHAAR